MKDKMIPLLKSYKQRCSSLGKIILPDPGLTQSETSELEKLSSRDKPMTELQKERYNVLIVKKNAKPELTQAAKTYLEEVYDEIETGFKQTIVSKYMENGTETEPDGLQLLSETLAPSILPIPDKIRYENDYLTGEIDKLDVGGLHGDIWDNKSAYFKETLSKAEFTKVYQWQGIRYLYLCISKNIIPAYNKKLDRPARFGLFYSLNDHSQRRIKRECDAEFYGNPDKYLTTEDPPFKDFCEKHEARVTYSKYLLLHQRFRVWFLDWKSQYEQKIIDSVVAAREYLLEIHETRIDEQLKNSQLMLQVKEWDEK